MLAHLVHIGIRWDLEGAAMSGFVNKFEDYRFAGFGGVDNCDYCDSFTHVNEWDRPDGGFVFVCNACEFTKRFPEKKAKG